MSNVKEALAKWDAADELLAEKIDEVKDEVKTKANNADLKNFTSITTLKIYSQGWYRFFEYNSDSQSTSRGSLAFAPTFTILRDYWDTSNEVHKIDLIGAYNAFKFINENSISNTFVTTKVRLVATSTKTYLDIFYSSSNTNRVTGIVMNADSSGAIGTDIYWEAISKPYKVEETVTGETVVATYSFSSNKSIESRIAALEAALASTTSETE